MFHHLKMFSFNNTDIKSLKLFDQLTKSLVRPKLNPTILNCHVEFFGKSSGTNTLNNLWYILLKTIASNATKIQRITIEARMLALQSSENYALEHNILSWRGGNLDSFPIFLVQSMSRKSAAYRCFLQNSRK